MQRSKPGRFFLVIIVILLIETSIPFRTITAQQDRVSLSILVFPGLEPLVEPLLQRYERDHPGIHISLKSYESMPLKPGTWRQVTVDEYFKQLEEAVSSADVVMVSSESVGIEGTRAGYMLDLKPLISADASLNDHDYQSQAWQIFQWENGFWALPFAYDTISLLYDPAAFKVAGINPPDASWTLDDLSTAARALAIRNKTGGVDTPGLYVPDPYISALFRTLSTEPFYDETTMPLAPRLTSARLASLVDAWSTVEAEGVFARGYNDPTKIPLMVGTSTMMRQDTMGSDREQHSLQGALLPGGKAAMTAVGFAVSSGTTHPDQAYQLVKYLIADEGITQVSPFQFPTRISLQKPNNGDGLGHVLASDNRTFVAQATEQAIPEADLLFGNYLPAALALAQSGKNVQDALQQAQRQASDAMTAAANKRQTVKIVVAAEPSSEPTGKINLTFGISDGSTSLLHGKEWVDLAKAFAEHDAQIGNIEFIHVAPTTSDWGKRVQQLPETSDCFFNAFVRPGDYRESDLLSLNPLIDADPTFNRADVIGAALDAVRSGTFLQALPIALHPVLLSYDKTQFEKAGVPLPVDGWRIEQFLDALTQLKAQSPDQPPFILSSDHAHYLRLLLAAYGILPIDPRTNPPTINLTAPRTIEAIRQVLDLARKGFINYKKSATFIFHIEQPKRRPAITVTSYDGFSGFADEQLTTFPVGSDFLPISYTLSAGYISASTSYPEACYRWLRTLSQHPELFDGMPAYHSLLADPRLTGLWTEDVAAAYKRLDQMLSSPKATPLQDAINGDPAGTLWLKRAFDNYILADANLETELARAEQFTKAYLACVQENPQPLPPPGGILVDCPFKVDPSIRSVFGG